MSKLLNKKEATAFSFLELSVVLVIISFLIVAVTEGADILKRSAIQSTIRQIVGYKGYYQDFKMTYSERPGDFSSAYAFFAGDNDSICGAKLDCNGDGDNILETGTKNNNSELLRAWQHLHLAGYESSPYRGVWDSKGNNYVVPTAKLSGGNISFVNDGGNYTDNYLKLGQYHNHENQYSDRTIFSTAEAYETDSKYDDGIANSGWILARGGTIDTLDDTVTDKCSNEAQYSLFNRDDPLCTLLFAIE